MKITFFRELLMKRILLLKKEKYIKKRKGNSLLLFLKTKIYNKFKFYKIKISSRKFIFNSKNKN